MEAVRQLAELLNWMLTGFWSFVTGVIVVVAAFILVVTMLWLLKVAGIYVLEWLMKKV